MQIFANGCALLVFFTLAFHVLLALWPAVDREEAPVVAGAVAAPPPDVKVEILFGLIDWTPSAATALLALVVLAGTLGGLVFTATSFSTHVAKNDFGTSWQWWYVLRPFTGAGLALITYLLIRGQLLGLNGPSEDLNPYGVAGLAALTGLFSKQAITKLGEVFDTLFAPAAPAPAPGTLAVDALDPDTVFVNTDNDVMVTGSGFQTGLTATVGGQSVTVGDLDTDSFTIMVPAAIAVAAGDLVVVVTNSDGSSATSTLHVQ